MQTGKRAPGRFSMLYLLSPHNAHQVPGGQDRNHRLDWTDYAAAVMLIVGLMLRVRLAVSSPFSNVAAGEAWRVAVAFAQSGTFADAYWVGQGPTTHVLPIMPFIAGTIMRVFGINTPASNLMLLGWALLQIVGAACFTYLLFRRIGLSRISLLIGAACFSLPLFPRVDIVDWRFWEGALTVNLVALSFLVLLDAYSQPMPRRSTMIKFSVLSALVFFLNPIAGVALYMAWAVYYLVRPRAIVPAALAAAAALAVLIVPWTLRNQANFGKLIPLRANFGLKFAIGNYPGALDPTDTRAEYNVRMAAIHPAKSEAARNEVRRIGEVTYFQHLSDETWRWVTSNPASFGTLLTRHAGNFLFPRLWSYDPFDRPYVRRIASVVVPAVSFLGLSGLVAGLLNRRRPYANILVYVLVATASYSLVQPIARYNYLIYVFLVFSAAGLIGDIARRVMLRRSQAFASSMG
jgi:hypothetical protein